MSLPAFTFNTTAEEVATTFAEQIRGKNVLITGTFINGMGFETARVLAKHANLVIITGYNTERLKLTEEAIKKESPDANIRPLVLDLASLAAVRKAAAEVNEYPEPIHVLIHNAAAGGAKELTPTLDGLEPQIATAHVGPFLFTKLIARKVLSASSASFTPRVVFVSSSVHAIGPGLDFDVLVKPDAAKYANFPAYAAAKSANILFANKLSKRSQGKINAYSLHPGAVFTNLNQKEQNKDDLVAVARSMRMGRPTPRNSSGRLSPREQQRSSLRHLIHVSRTRGTDKAGAFLVDCVIANEQIAPHSSNSVSLPLFILAFTAVLTLFICAVENAAKLWTISEEVVGEKFAF
ncbi:hypothetical protein DFH06DRAFT_553499 [Mycena polygramma]|nr:hypothetical protein DFH06DRAFT_553499 [Mycena polygramma]